MSFVFALVQKINDLFVSPHLPLDSDYSFEARHREAERDYADRNFIRVDWPAVPLEQVIDIVARDGAASPFHRMCISMITHPRSDDDTVSVLKRWTARIDPAAIPVSILSNPTTMTRADVQRLRDLGADIFTVALDDEPRWRFHKGKFMARLSRCFDYKLERKERLARATASAKGDDHGGRE